MSSGETQPQKARRYGETRLFRKNSFASGRLGSILPRWEVAPWGHTRRGFWREGKCSLSFARPVHPTTFFPRPIQLRRPAIDVTSLHARRSNQPCLVWRAPTGGRPHVHSRALRRLSAAALVLAPVFSTGVKAMAGAVIFNTGSEATATVAPVHTN